MMKRKCLHNRYIPMVRCHRLLELEDLESPLGPQLQAPFVWPEEPIIDEADNSDMTPQCMPVIDPNFVRESFIEDCLLGGKLCLQ